MVGSHDVRRKEMFKREKTVKDYVTKEPVLDENGNPKKIIIEGRSKFWDCLTEPVKNLLDSLASFGKKDVIVFGEMIGMGIQDMHYGTKFDFRAFDIMVECKYLDFEEKLSLLENFNVAHVPVLYRGPFSQKVLEEYVDGPTTMCKKEDAGPFSGREGIVITPIKERYDPNIKGDGRVILKAVSFAYHERKDGTEFH